MQALFSIRNVDEQEGGLGVHELLVIVWRIAALDCVVVEECIGHLHQCFVHSVLSVEKFVRITSLDQPRVHRSWTFNFEV